MALLQPGASRFWSMGVDGRVRPSTPAVWLDYRVNIEVIGCSYYVCSGNGGYRTLVILGLYRRHRQLLLRFVLRVSVPARQAISSSVSACSRIR